MLIPNRAINLDFALTKQQKMFIAANDRNVDEVLYGGAAGGGKTYAQCVDALLYAIKYPASHQIIFRRTFVELELSVIRESMRLYPRPPHAKYNASAHRWTFYNGSVIEFGYLAHEGDETNYQGAEFDVVRFDEATTMTWEQIDYLRSRIRGTAQYPRLMKLTTNPGNVGHTAIKGRYVTPAPPGQIFKGGDDTRRLFIPARVYDNLALMDTDPKYVKRLEAMADENARRALLLGDWDVWAGQYYPEFSRDLHVIEPFNIEFKSPGVKLYRSLDYGLDCCACLWYAVCPPDLGHPNGRVILYRELWLPDLPISSAVEAINKNTTADERITSTFAPPDVMRNRDRTTGRNQGDLFQAAGLTLHESNNDRKAGWLAIKELLKVRNGAPMLQIFSTCRHIIKDLPLLVHDSKHPGDTLTEPHEITHAPDSLRYFAIQWTSWGHVETQDTSVKYVRYPKGILANYRALKTSAERKEFEKMMGGKPLL